MKRCKIFILVMLIITQSMTAYALNIGDYRELGTGYTKPTAKFRVNIINQKTNAIITSATSSETISIGTDIPTVYATVGNILDFTNLSIGNQGYPITTLDFQYQSLQETKNDNMITPEALNSLKITTTRACTWEFYLCVKDSAPKSSSGLANWSDNGNHQTLGMPLLDFTDGVWWYFTKIVVVVKAAPLPTSTKAPTATPKPTSTPTKISTATPVLYTATPVIYTATPEPTNTPMPTSTPEPTTPNEPPIAIIDAPSRCMQGQEVNITGIDSYDPDGEIVQYDWSLPGTSSVITVVSGKIKYNSTGQFAIHLTVTDDRGATGSTYVYITVEPPLPEARITTSGKLVENRKVVLNSNTSWSIPAYPIVETKWELLPYTSTVTQDDIKCKDFDFDWTSQYVDNRINCITYGKGMFVALTAKGSGDNKVITSPDGINWTVRSPAPNFYATSIIYGNGLFVAISPQKVMASSDGINWTIGNPATTNEWKSVTYGNGIFVAVSRNGSGNRVMTSTDGLIWTSRVSAADNEWQSVTYGSGLFVAVANTGINRVMTSPDGINWTLRTAAADNSWSSIIYGNGLFVAVAGSGESDKVMTSLDGITWTLRAATSNDSWTSVTYGNGLFVAIAYMGTGSRMMTSQNGINWTARTVNGSSWINVAYGNGVFVVVSVDYYNSQILTSNFIKYNTSSKSALNTLYKKPGTYLAKLTVKNSAGYSDSVSMSIIIKEDAPPLPSAGLLAKVLRDQVDENGIHYAVIEMVDQSTSPDGDELYKWEWAYKYDSDNDGNFAEETYTPITAGIIERTSFNTSKVGKYGIFLKVTEKIPDIDTIPEFVSESDYKKASGWFY